MKIFGIIMIILYILGFVAALYLASVVPFKRHPLIFIFWRAMSYYLLISAFLLGHTRYGIPSFCEKNAISYELVESISEYTGESTHDIAYFLKYAANAEVDLYDAIEIIDPSLSNEDITAIINFSDNKQNK